MRRTAPLLIVVIGLAALIIDFLPNLQLPVFGDPEGASRTVETKLGLDLEGGLRVEYRVMPAGGRAPSAGDVSTVRDIIERRVNATGVAEPLVQTQGVDRVVVELPGVSDPESVRKLVGQTGRLDFVPLGDTQMSEGDTIDLAQYPPLFSGDQVESATVGASQTGGRTVDFKLKGDGASAFGKYTAANIGKYFAIVLDGTVISAPVIRSAIPGGDVQIEAGSGLGGFSAKEANNLVTVLRFGSLPFPVQELSNDQIPATLGSEFLRQSLIAGFIGIALVFLFMLIYYRLPGLVADTALIYYTLVVLAIFRLVPVTLTLAGIAAFVLSVGMAVDANVLIFERTKEELRLGKSLSAAIEAGFNRAWNSILDSNVSSLITAGILYWFGSSIIRGFALVLIIGVLVSMFTAITVTRTILRFVVRQDSFRRAWLYGVSDEEFLSRPTGRPALRGEARSRV